MTRKWLVIQVMCPWRIREGFRAQLDFDTAHGHTQNPVSSHLGMLQARKKRTYEQPPIERNWVRIPPVKGNEIKHTVSIVSDFRLKFERITSDQELEV